MDFHEILCVCSRYLRKEQMLRFWEGRGCRGMHSEYFISGLVQHHFLTYLLLLQPGNVHQSLSSQCISSCKGFARKSFNHLMCNIVCGLLVQCVEFLSSLYAKSLARVPETLDVWGDPWQPVDPIHNPMFLYELCTSLQNLRNWGEETTLSLYSSLTEILTNWTF